MNEMKTHKVDILGISEVKKKGSGEAKLERDYTLIYAGVPKGSFAKEGVGIAMTPEMFNKLEDWEPVSSRIIAADFQMSIGKVTLVQVYAPTEDTVLADKELFYSDLQRLVNRIRNKGRYAILSGDFNARTGCDPRVGYGVLGLHGGERTRNGNGQRLIEFCIENDLLVGNSFYPHKRIHKITFSSQDRNSIIDYFVYDRSVRQYLMDIKVIRGAEIGSDHLLLIADTKILPELQTKQKKKHYLSINVRALESIEKRTQYTEKLEERLRALVLEGDIERLWNALKTCILEVGRDVCDLRKVTGNRKRSEWWSEEIKCIVQQKKKAWKAYLQDRTPERLSVYHSARNECKTKVRQAKKESWEKFGRSLDEDHRDSIKKFWRKVKALRGKLGKPVRNIKDERGVIITEEARILERWKQFYEGQFSRDPNHTVEQLTLDNNNQESQECIDEEEVVDAIEKIKVGKAAGRDGIAPELIKYGGQELVKVLQQLFQQVWDRKKIPREWEYSIIIPIYKKGSSTECENYRPISLLSVVYKLYTSIMEKRLRAMVENRIEDEQAGFRPGKQTQDHIFVLRSITEKAWDRDKDIFLAFLDLKAAFDSVPRNEIWKALVAKDIPGDLISAIKSAYHEAKGVVRINGKESEAFCIERGVRQGDSLSPLLFIIFMDEIHKICKRRTAWTAIGKWNLRTILVQSLLYADDIVLITDSQEKMQEALTEWQEELLRKGMVINTSKSKILVLSREEPEEVHLICNGETLEVVPEFTYLGTVISSSGKIDPEISHRITRANQVYYQVCNSIIGHREVGVETKRHVYKSVYLPTLIYGSESWVMLDKQTSRITAAEMRFLRRAVGKTRRDRIRNEQIRELFEVTELRKTIETRQLKWFGHVCRMEDEREPRKVLEARPTGKRPRGRPRISYQENIQRIGGKRGKTLQQMKNLSRDRSEWLRFIEAPRR